MSEENNPVIEEIEKEIESTKQKASEDDFEIEIAEDKVEAKADNKEEPLSEEVYSAKVERRVKKLVEQRRNAEIEAKAQAEQNAQLSKRLERLEQGTQNQAQGQANKEFENRYSLTKQALTKAVEEGDTEAQVNFQEQMADMRATIRVNEMQRQMRQTQAVSPTVGRAQQNATNPTPQKAMGWWESNRWFNSKGYERETAAARAIDVYDKEGDDYYSTLNSRLQKVFPELTSSNDQSRQRAKVSKVVAPSTGGSSYKGNRVRMTQDQLRMARELGINDEASLKKYVSEIQKSQRS